MTNVNPQFGILLHQLRKDDISKATDFLPQNIRCKNYDDLGLRVYFFTKESAEESIRKKSIQVNGISYNIYPLITCLTVIGIGRSARSMDIKNSLETIGCSIIENYSVNDCVDHRIVLDVPEVQANFPLTDISVPENPNKKFPVVFYCRCCGGDHKQYQCISSLRTTAVLEDGGNSSRPSNQRNASVRRPNTEGPVPSTSRTLTAAERPTQGLLHRTKLMQRRKPGVQSKPQNRRTASTKKKRRSRKGEFPCEIIKEVILQTPGYLEGERMIQFLEHVYGKKELKLVQITSELAPNNTALIALIKQLESIEPNYHQFGESNSEADKDLRIISGLCNRLRKLI